MMVLLSLLTACGGSDSSEDSNFKSKDATTDETPETGGVDAIDDTASTVITSDADVNGFLLATTVFNPRSYDFIGTEVDLIATVKDHSNNPVADGTVITFIADDNGYVEDQCTTVSGSCTVKWRSARDRNQPVDPDAANDNGYENDHLITVMARTIGEDSFIDKNANSLFDEGETYFTQSEAFLDANDDGDYDSGNTDYDEYSDFNNNGSFDGNEVFTRFRGTSCSSSARALGHCAQKLEVWDTIRLVNSSGQPGSIRLFQGSCSAQSVTTVTTVAVGTYCLEVLDPHSNIPPVGTKINVTTDNGSIDLSPNAVANVFADLRTGYRSDVRLKGDGNSSSGTMTIKIEWLSGEEHYYYITFDD